MSLKYEQNLFAQSRISDYAAAAFMGSFNISLPNAQPSTFL